MLNPSWRLTFWSGLGRIIGFGVLAYLGATAWLLVLIVVVRAFIDPMADIMPSAQAEVHASTYLTTLLLAPWAESFLFVGLWLACRKLWPGSHASAFVIVMGFVGWAAHGASPLSFGRGIGFALLAKLFADRATEASKRSAFYETSGAHLVWNALAVMTSFGASSLR